MYKLQGCSLSKTVSCIYKTYLVVNLGNFEEQACKTHAMIIHERMLYTIDLNFFMLHRISCDAIRKAKYVYILHKKKLPECIIKKNI